MRAIVVVVACLLCMTTGCTSDSGDRSGALPTPPALVEDPTGAGDSFVTPPTSNLEISDAVPSLDELRAMGLGDLAAECFITTIDPEGTGRVTSAELFMEAFGACL